MSDKTSEKTKDDEVVSSFEERLARILEWYMAASESTRDAAAALRGLQQDHFLAMSKLGDPLPDGAWNAEVIAKMADVHDELASGLEVKIATLVSCLRDEARAMRAGNVVFAEVRGKIS